MLSVYSGWMWALLVCVLTFFKAPLPSLTAPASITFDDANKETFPTASHCAASWNICFEDLKTKKEKKNTFSSPQPLTPPSPDLQWALPWAAPTHMHIRSIILVCVWARMIHHRGDVRGRWWWWGSSGHPSSAANMRIFVNASHHPLLFLSKILLHSAASKHIYPPGICPVWGQEKLYNARSLSETRTWNVLSEDLNNGFNWCACVDSSHKKGFNTLSMQKPLLIAKL